MASIYLIVYAFGTLEIELIGFLGYGFAAFWLVMMFPAMANDFAVMRHIFGGKKE